MHLLYFRGRGREFPCSFYFFDCIGGCLVHDSDHLIRSNPSSGVGNCVYFLVTLAAQAQLHIFGNSHHILAHEAHTVRSLRVVEEIPEVEGLRAAYR